MNWFRSAFQIWTVLHLACQILKKKILFEYMTVLLKMYNLDVS